MADVDADALDVALSNLVDNALKYSFRGLVVEIRGRGEAGRVVITVEDLGLGIAEVDSEVIYEGWQRRAYDPIRSISGSGLGLPLARAIARAHGGDLVHESRPHPGEGHRRRRTRADVTPHVVTFRLSFPARGELR
jgi:signal transduction histidine kinase